MRITQQLTLPLLAVTFSLAFVAHGMPHDGSSIDDALGLHKRDATSDYVVYPKDTTNKDQATAIGNLLKGVVSDAKNISVHDTNKGVFFWGAPLTSANAQKVGADSNVSLCSHLRSLGSHINELRLPQSSKGVERQIAPIQRNLITPTLAIPNQGALKTTLAMKRYLASQGGILVLSIRIKQPQRWSSSRCQIDRKSAMKRTLCTTKQPELASLCTLSTLARIYATTM